ncbi:MAG: hypothetical protein ACUVWX_05270 [Kiritimatiellia bacterium]
MRMVRIGKALASGLCIGGNPFSGFSHQSDARDREMREYYTPERVKHVLRQCEETGINTCFMRTDDHICGIISSYWREGGRIQWFAQISQDKDDPDSWRKWLRVAIDLGATGTYLHGGAVDYWYGHKQFEFFYEALELMRQAGTVAGFAGHKPQAHAWIRDHLQVDFQMCSHYNPSDRTRNPAHTNVNEKWNEEDRSEMLAVIETIRTPVVHYKVFAGGNRPIIPAWELLGQVMKPNHVVCAGMFLKDDPEMIAKNVAFFEKYVEQRVFGGTVVECPARR